MPASPWAAPTYCSWYHSYIRGLWFWTLNFLLRCSPDASTASLIWGEKQLRDAPNLFDGRKSMQGKLEQLDFNMWESKQIRANLQIGGGGLEVREAWESQAWHHLWKIHILPLLLRWNPNTRLRLSSHLLDVLQWDPVLAELLVDEDEGVEVAHSPVQQLIWQPAWSLHHSLVVLQQPGREAQRVMSQSELVSWSTVAPVNRS